MLRHAAMSALALFLIACGQEVTQAPSPSPLVRIARVGGDVAAPAVYGVGTVALRREVSLGFTSAGRIARLSVNEGDEVRAGQLLAALDTTVVAADSARATAELDRAAADYRRSETLLQQGWITRPRLESAKANLLAAEAQRRSSGFQASNATIVAQGSGTVLARLAEPGQVVPVGTPVLVIGEDASGYILRVPLTDRDTAGLSIGAPATVRLSALGDVPITGRLIELAGRADRATGTFAAEIALPADRRLRSGQIGDVRITTRGPAADTIAVPPGAVFAPRAGTGFVYVVDRRSKRVAVRKVSLGETGDGGITVTAGLRRGEWVATSRIDRLRDGMTVVPIEPAR